MKDKPRRIKSFHLTGKDSFAQQSILQRWQQQQQQQQQSPSTTTTTHKHHS